MVKIASYGTWTSPIGAGDTAKPGGGFQWADLSGERVWWAESRPAEGGRVALVRDGVDVLPAPWNARNRVHEYGGRPFVVLAEDRVAFTHWADQRVYVFNPDDPRPAPLTPEPERHHGIRYADLSAGPDGEVWCVRETITGDTRTDVRRDLVAITSSGEVRVLAASHHFMTGPKISPDGTRFAWIGWNHPQMPWDGAELCVAELVASLVKRQVECHGSRSRIDQPIDEPGMQRPRPGIELRRLADGAGRFARDPHDDDVVGRGNRAAQLEQSAKPERLLERERRRQHTGDEPQQR